MAVRVVRADNRPIVSVIGMFTMIGGVIGLMLFGSLVESHPTIALIGICATTVWLLVGLVTCLILATEPI